MKKKILIISLVLLTLVPGVFYAGYAANQHRVFPIRPFVKRVLIEYGFSERVIEKFRAGKLPSVNLETSTLDLDSGYYEFVGKIYDLPSSSRYGGIVEFGSGLLFVDGKGSIWFFKDGEFKSIKSDKIPVINELNKGNKTIDKELYDGFEFTVRDVEIVDNFIYASATEYVVAQECITLVLYRAELSGSSESTLKIGDWTKVFDAKPCLPRLDGGDNLDMIEAGGRIIKFSADHILLSVGEFAQNGVRAKAQAQDDASHYGKIIKLDLATFTPTIFTKGHRNPQGLMMTENATILSTEHGPQGGDELNVIVEGKNYGWPLVTYGTDYGEKNWPLDKGKKDHSGFEKPIYSWLPSIGVSNLIQVRNKSLPNWDGDILVSSLFKVSLFRIEMNGLSPVVVEPIYVGSRIRDITNFGEGFALQTDQENQLIVMELKP